MKSLESIYFCSKTDFLSPNSSFVYFIYAFGAQKIWFQTFYF